MKNEPLKNIQSKSVWFYAGFFFFYFLALYLSLYQYLDLQPFQVNFHFFSNAISTIFKRFLADGAPYALLFLLIYYTRKKWLRVFFMALFFVFFLLNVAEIGFYNQTQNHFQVFILEGFQWRISLSMLGPIKVMIISFLAIFCIFWGIFLWKTKNKNKKKIFPRQKVLIIIAFLLAFHQAYSPIFYDLSATLATSDHIKKKLFHLMALEDSGVQVFGQEAINYFFPEIIEPKMLSLQEEEDIELSGIDEREETFFKNAPKNIVLIVAESLNQDFVSHYNPYLEASTPFLDELIKDNEKLDNFYPSGPYTIHGLSSMLCGHPNLEYARSSNNHECAPQFLKNKGYRTEFIRGFSKFYIGENLTFKKFGFDHIFAQEELDLKYPEFKEERPDLYNTWGFSDDYVFNEAISRLKEANESEKQFLTLLTVDTHTPGGRCYDHIKPEDEENQMLFSVKCLDRALKSFFEQLEHENLLQETLILITSDQLYPNATNIPGENFQTSFKLIPGKIPLIMISDQGFTFKANQGSQVDIAATLLDLVNTPVPEYYFGKSLLSNETTVPVGQNGNDTYIKLGNQFHHFALKGQEQSGSSQGSLEIQIQVNHTKDLFEQVTQAREEIEASYDPISTLFKWYYNKFFYHEI